MTNEADMPGVRGFFKRLRAKLNQGPAWLTTDIVELLPGRKIDAEILDDLETRLIMADVGVAGVHRLFSRLEVLQRANVVIVVAGMEGALPSVVGGLVSRPVIAVPTSIGYGASFGGLAALLGMLNSCASGMTVVNIDNGFGAGYAASQINALASE